MEELKIEEIFKLIREIPKDNENINIPSYKSRIFMFFSFDLSNSTIFKSEHPSLWSSVFSNFYSEILENLKVGNYEVSGQESEDTTVRKLWKLIGDEVLIYMEINKLNELYFQIKSISKSLENIMKNIAAKVQKELESSYDEYCNEKFDIREIILSSLGIKTTCWIADCYEKESLSKYKSPSNIVYLPSTILDNKIDFLGKEIDEGFRIAKYAVKDRIIVSPLLAWLIWKNAQHDTDMKKIVNSNFKITAFIAMKGVWRGRKVPVVMYHDNFEKFSEILEYDELDIETYDNIKEYGYENFMQNERFCIEKIDRILNDVYKIKDAEFIYNALKDNDKTNILVPLDTSNTSREFHLACMIFIDDKNILVHRDPDRGLDFGCIRDTKSQDGKTWGQLCEKGYKKRYGIDIKVDDCPIPVATYHYKKRNAHGLIVLAEYAGKINELDTYKEEWHSYDIHKLIEGKEKSVDGFKDDLKRALQLRGGKI